MFFNVPIVFLVAMTKHLMKHKLGLSSMFHPRREGTVVEQRDEYFHAIGFFHFTP